MEGTPKQNDYVLATVKKILPYGAFCGLDEYGGKEAFLHISEVAPRWVKNIHEFLKEGQKLVAIVYRLDLEKNQIDLSLKRVTDSEKKRKMEDFRLARRAEKLIELAAKKIGKQQESQEVINSLSAAFTHPYAALEELSDKGVSALDKTNLSEAWRKALLETATTNIKHSNVSIKRKFIIRVPSGDGVVLLRSALTSYKQTPGAEAKIHYFGAPHYSIEVTAEDYKKAEKAIAQILEQVEKTIAPAKGTVAVEQESK
ncbi:Translation initiation factor 2 subunit alpha [Candidatus Gugararchaeum adminiculabundum]|nr:Translation initiation factor 2 subunit alpha [Candidatus Gugararchaeum adminiculabundum]